MLTRTMIQRLKKAERVLYKPGEIHKVMVYNIETYAAALSATVVLKRTEATETCTRWYSSDIFINDHWIMTPVFKDIVKLNHQK